LGRGESLGKVIRNCAPMRSSEAGKRKNRLRIAHIQLRRSLAQGLPRRLGLAAPS